jgi:DNA polymerase III delta prime subunit
MIDTTPWSLKYKPSKVEEMVLNDDLMKYFQDVVKTENLNNISIFGHPGIGKTTLAKILVDQLDCEFWIQPCSIDGSIEMIKTTIKDFCDIIPRGKYKVIILDEADQLSQQAQMALRNIIVDSLDNCRFILTANYQDKVIDALKSRCTPIKLEFSSKDILKFCINILKKEEIKYTKESILDFFETIITKKYPDIRAIIEHLQMMSISGELKVIKSNETIIKNDIVDYIHKNILNDIKKIREYLISNEDKFSADYVNLAQELFDVYDTSPEIMLIISDTLWRMSFQLDKEIQFTSMLINIQNILKRGRK